MNHAYLYYDFMLIAKKLHLGMENNYHNDVFIMKEAFRRYFGLKDLPNAEEVSEFISAEPKTGHLIQALLEEGLPHKMIAERLKVSVPLVKHYRAKGIEPYVNPVLSRMFKPEKFLTVGKFEAEKPKDFEVIKVFQTIKPRKVLKSELKEEFFSQLTMPALPKFVYSKDARMVIVEWDMEKWFVYGFTSSGNPFRARVDKPSKGYASRSRGMFFSLSGERFYLEDFNSFATGKPAYTSYKRRPLDQRY